jgi:Rrf2 family protein
MFSATSGYALRTLVCLAQLPKEASVPGRELSQQADVPANYMSKMLLTLRNAGIVSATRGSGGGYRLRGDALDVPLLKVVELFEGPRAKPACLLGQEYKCSDENPCSAHEAWRHVREAFLEFLETKTLADIAKEPLPERVRRRDFEVVK